MVGTEAALVGYQRDSMARESMAWKRREMEYQRPHQGKPMKSSGGSRYPKRHEVMRAPPANGPQEFDQGLISARVDPSVTSSRNLESFIAHVTPRVKLQFTPKEAEGNISRSRAGEAAQCAFFSLGDLWDSLEEWSSYGAGVPLQLANGTYATQYYAPSISGMQLYSRKSRMHAPGSRPDSAAGSVWSDEIRNSAMGDSEANGISPLPRVTDSFSDRSPAMGWDACQDCAGGELMLEFFERAPPHMRLPLFSKVLDLQRDSSFLWNLCSFELHPQSWVAIAWYPLYKIPAGLSSRELGASFLTFHSLSSPPPAQQGMCSRCSDQYWISPLSLPQPSHFSPQKLSGALDMWPSDHQSSKVPTTALPPFGFTGYKAKGNMWSDRWNIQSLEIAADQWLKQIGTNLPDHAFFSSQQYVH